MKTWRLPHPSMFLIWDLKVRVKIQDKFKKSRNRCKNKENPIRCLYISNSNDSQERRDQIQLSNNSWTEALSMKGMKETEVASSWHRMSLTRLKSVMPSKISHRHLKCLQLKTNLQQSQGRELNLLTRWHLFRQSLGFQTKSTLLIREEYREVLFSQIIS